MARSVWGLFSEGLVENMCLTRTPNAKIWIFSMHDAIPHDEFIKMVVTLWGVWHARRKAVHEEFFQSPLLTHLFINLFLLKLQMLEKHVTTVTRAAPSRPNHWLAPPDGLSKINVDATLTRNESIGAVGEVCRDHHGAYMGASAIVFLGISDPTTLSCDGSFGAG